MDAGWNGLLYLQADAGATNKSQLEGKMQKMALMLILLMLPFISYASDCHVVSFADHDEIVCDGKPAPPPPPKPPKKPQDAKSPERKSTIKAITKLKSQFDVSARDFQMLFVDAKAEVEIYFNTAKDYSEEDRRLAFSMETAISIFELFQLQKIACAQHNNRVSSNPCDEARKSYEEYLQKLQEAIEYYNDTWQ